MMKKIYFKIIIILISLIILTNCKNDNFETTKSGIKYKFLERDKDDERKEVKFGTVIDYHLIVKNNKDSVVQSTYESRPITGFQVMDSVSKGDFNEAIRLLAEGDSALVKISVDTLAKRIKKKVKERIKMTREQQKSVKENKNLDKKTKEAQLSRIKNQLIQLENQEKNPLPKYFPEETYISFIFKILKVKTKEDIEKEQAEAMKKQEEQRKKQKIADEKAIKKYLKDESIKEKALSSGLYYVIEKKGSGEKPKVGDSVSVNYVGKLLDGKVFDTSFKDIAEENEIVNPQRTYEPFTFVLGKQQVIKGWDEGIALLRKGGKAKLFVPSNLAYGARGMGRAIPPNSVLIFEVELVDID